MPPESCCIFPQTTKRRHGPKRAVQGQGSLLKEKIRTRAEEDTQKRHRMPVSDQRQPLGRQLLPPSAEWQTREIQCLRRNERAVRNQTRRDDRRKESRDRGRESQTKRGRRVRRPLIIWK